MLQIIKEGAGKLHNVFYLLLLYISLLQEVFACFRPFTGNLLELYILPVFAYQGVGVRMAFRKDWLWSWYLRKTSVFKAVYHSGIMALIETLSLWRAGELLTSLLLLATKGSYWAEYQLCDVASFHFSLSFNPAESLWIQTIISCICMSFCDLHSPWKQHAIISSSSLSGCLRHYVPLWASTLLVGLRIRFEALGELPSYVSGFSIMLFRKVAATHIFWDFQGNSILFSHVVTLVILFPVFLSCEQSVLVSHPMIFRPTAIWCGLHPCFILGVFLLSSSFSMFGKLPLVRPIVNMFSVNICALWLHKLIPKFFFYSRRGRVRERSKVLFINTNFVFVGLESRHSHNGSPQCVHDHERLLHGT